MSRRRRSRWILAVSAAVGLLLLSITDAADGAQPADVPLDELRVATTEVAAGLARPTAIAALNDGSGRLLITEKAGTVRGFHPGSGLEAEPVLDLNDRVNATENERGLLGLAVGPDFTQRQAVYVAYTAASDNAVTLSRVRLDTGAEEVLLTQPHAEFGNHNGGHVAFGPDGHLYLGIGDGGGGGDPLQNGQNLNTLLGKIIRIDVGSACGELPYCVPADNPFVGVAGAREEIWSYGLRNPWRFSFDQADGSLWIADVGQGSFEEVDHVAGTQGGVNFGWSCKEGPNIFDEARCAPDAQYTDPVFHYATGAEGCAVIGGFVYRGAEFADLAAGTYVATDYCSATAFGLRANADGTHTSGTIGTFPESITAFGTDEAGELYAVDDRPGRLFRVSFEHVPTA
jgi:glucose/arabinose dehydrogenase